MPSPRTRLAALLALQLGFAATAHAAPATAGAAKKKVDPSMSPQVLRHRVQVQFVRTADTDGASPSTLTKAGALAAIAEANEIWQRNGGIIEFVLDPRTKFGEVVKDTLLNRRCIVKAGETAASIAANTNADLDGDGKPATDADKNLLCSTYASGIRRTAFGAERGDRIVVLSGGGNQKVKFVDGHWNLVKAGGGGANPKGTYITIGHSAHDNLLAHELGHYFHVSHTFESQPTTIADARALIEKYAAANPTHDPADAFNGDMRSNYPVHDTPPDPSIALFVAVHGTQCDPAKGTIDIPRVNIGGSSRTIRLAPDRRVITGYYKGCDFDFYLTAQQLVNVRTALLEGNRRDLVDADATCYASESTPPRVSTPEQLSALIRKLVRCRRLVDAGWGWEQLDQIYPPGDGAQPGDTTKDGIRVVTKREAPHIAAMFATPEHEE
ncbi:MAG TPA: hypothetical protein VG755_05780 [Nannocystaceae bacterium]|nr:hypothetical protein [Nannocystaceae bacterium]